MNPSDFFVDPIFSLTRPSLSLYAPDLSADSFFLLIKNKDT